MADKIRILIGDNEAGWGDQCAKLFDTDSFEVAVVESDYHLILNQIYQRYPHIIVIKTFMSHISSFGFMKLCEKIIDYNPKFIVIDSNDNLHIKQLIMEQGACACLFKPFTPEYIYHKIQDISEQLIYFNSPQVHTLEQAITKLLFDLRVPPHMLGYSYLRRAVTLCFNNVGFAHTVTKALYPLLSEEFGSNIINIEHSIRGAITAAWKHTDHRQWVRFFPNNKRPTNSHFIATVSEYLHLESHWSATI